MHLWLKDSTLIEPV